jgi:hypothetical protein
MREIAHQHYARGVRGGEMKRLLLGVLGLFCHTLLL